MSDWTFFTNHAHVLHCVARDSNARMRDIAARVGITERAAQGIVSDLVEAGYVERRREGRRNRYVLNEGLPFRHPLEEDLAIGEVLKVLLRPRAPRAPEGGER